MGDDIGFKRNFNSFNSSDQGQRGSELTERKRNELNWLF